MVSDDYTARIQAMVIVVFFHYAAYLVFLALEVMEFPHKIHIAFGVSTGPRPDRREHHAATNLERRATATSADLQRSQRCRLEPEREVGRCSQPEYEREMEKV